MLSCEKIIIVGFSGAGKTTFLKAIQETAPSGWDTFNDLDQLIFKKFSRPTEKTLSDLIKRIGWDDFRLKERQTWEGWLKEEGKGVLSFGGGALTPVVWQMLRSSSKIKFCYLKADFEVCFERLKADHDQPRPLMDLGEEMLRKVYFEREQIFRQIPWKIDNSSFGHLEEKAQLFWKGY